MAHFAKVTNNIVEDVIVISDEHAPDPYPQSETLGQQFIHSLGIPGVWLQTSYNGNFRKHYAGVGYSYNAEFDAFIPPQPYSSWSLHPELLTWIPPQDYPTDEHEYYWEESIKKWLKVTHTGE